MQFVPVSRLASACRLIPPGLMPYPRLRPFRPSTIQFVRLAITVLLPHIATTLHAATCVTPPTDMVAWWLADNSSLDQLGSAHLTRGSSVGYTNGVSGSAFSFIDNVNSVFVLPPRVAWMPAGNQLTIECWIKPDFTVSGDKLDTILSKRDGCGVISYQFGVYKGHQSKKGPLYFNFGNIGGDSTSSIPNDGQFHHVAVTLDGSQPNSNIRFYIDGAPAGVINGPGVLPVTSSAPVIGAHGGCGYYSQMALDELSFYHRVLSASEIQAIHAAGSAGKCASPISGATLPLVADFENGTGPGWTGGTTLSTTEP
ncbi:MAG: LamG domain-containing protein, partial [Verrucomicrobia bacterium]|nr:LamG domain-containing protein [Verrucomicrobiota bacterium]